MVHSCKLPVDNNATRPPWLDWQNGRGGLMWEGDFGVRPRQPLFRYRAWWNTETHLSHVESSLTGKCPPPVPIKEIQLKKGMAIVLPFMSEEQLTIVRHARRPCFDTTCTQGGYYRYVHTGHTSQAKVVSRRGTMADVFGPTNKPHLPALHAYGSKGGVRGDRHQVTAWIHRYMCVQLCFPPRARRWPATTLLAALHLCSNVAAHLG